VGILALQNDVAQQVAEALALKLLPAEQARLADAKTVDPVVYELCLKGRSHMERLTKADFDTAEQYFQQALGKDPASAEAHAGMAGLWLNRQQMGVVSAREAGPKAKAAALRAIELDDTLAAAHSALASVRFLTDFNFLDADREFRRAIELDPNDPGDLALHSQVLLILGRPDEAMPQIERAVAIDPLNQLCRVWYGFNLHATGRLDEALAQFRGVLRLQPGNLAALSMIVQVAHLKKQYADAIAAATTFYEGMGWGDVAEALKKAFAESGYVTALRRAADVELAKHGNEGGVAFDAASNYAMAGDRARALDSLERAYADRDPNMPYIGCNRIFDPLRAEPRFQALLRQMNLPQ
jgi:serine/threonine-protein kinase